MSLPGWSEWVWTDATALVMAAVSTLVVYVALILYARIFGLRSFSKMSSFDFAMTIALGSLFASSISGPSPPLLLALVCLLLLFLGQKLVAFGRRSRPLKKLVDNEPLLLMRDGAPIRENMRRANVTDDDLRAKLREANVLDPAQVKAVVFETTGDVSVLHGGVEEELHADLLNGVSPGPAHGEEHRGGFQLRSP